MPPVTHELHNGYTTTAVAHHGEQAHNFSHKYATDITHSTLHTTWANMPPVTLRTAHYIPLVVTCHL